MVPVYLFPQYFYLCFWVQLRVFNSFYWYSYLYWILFYCAYFGPYISLIRAYRMEYDQRVSLAAQKIKNYQDQILLAKNRIKCSLRILALCICLQYTLKVHECTVDGRTNWPTCSTVSWPMDRSLCCSRIWRSTAWASSNTFRKSIHFVHLTTLYFLFLPPAAIFPIPIFVTNYRLLQSITTRLYLGLAARELMFCSP